MNMQPGPHAAHVRRRRLTRILKLLALIGAAFAAWPFIAALLPDVAVDAERRQRWERVIDLSKLQPGEIMTIDDWPGGPVSVYRRSAREIDVLTRIEDQLHDPRSGQSEQPAELRTTLRSRLPEYFVFIPAETARGCHVRYVPANQPPNADIVWSGGFVDLCFGSLYDVSGRVYRRGRADRQRNLAVPAYSVTGLREVRLDRAAPRGYMMPTR